MDARTLPPMRKAALAAAFVLPLAACAGGALPLAGPGAARIEAGGDVFFIHQTGERAVVQNFATGLNNQTRLINNAMVALAAHSGCRIESFVQRPDLNTYDATLDCAA